MQNIYENIYIGHFIYACGRVSGQHSSRHYESVNLLQQTPGDKLLGDLMMSEGVRCLLVEFKRSAEDMKTETEKPLRQKLITSLKEEAQEPLLSISRKAHFLGFPYEHQLYFTGYADFFHKADPDPLSMDSMIRRFYIGEIVYNQYDMANEMFVGAPSPEFMDYIKYMAELDPSPRPGGIGGLVLVTNEKKQEMFIPFTSPEELLRVMEMPIPEIISVRQEEIREEVKEELQQVQEKVKTAPIQLRAGGG